MKDVLRRIHWILSVQFGLDAPRFLRGVAALPAFFADASRYRKLTGERIELLPCLHDKSEESGSARGEYFWQDLFVAQLIHERAPVRHIDVGSRIDGFVAHVAAYRRVEVIDVRPLSIANKNIEFRQVDLTDGSAAAAISADSVSCLHALEHFGLGRYGDPLRADGHILGINNLAKLVAPGGTLYISMPSGRPRTLFNANRIIDPQQVVDAAVQAGLTLQALFHYDSVSNSIVRAQDTNGALAWIRDQPYVLAIYVFERVSGGEPSVSSM